MTETTEKWTAAQEERPLDVKETSAVVVGGGPAGAVLSLLLTRRGVEVTLLESHGDFNRKFRGDSLHPSILEIMDSVGLAGKLHGLPHTKVPTIPIETPDGPMVPADLRHLKSPYKYIMLAPQHRFLELVTEEAARYGGFRLVMGANVRRLVWEDGRVVGVRYRAKDGWHEVRAGLVVATDGRNSKVRRLADLEAVTTSPPLDVLWFELPKEPGDPKRTFGRIAGGHFVGVFDRVDHWNIEVTIPKGDYGRLKKEGIGALRREAARALPEFSSRLDHLRGWNQVSVLSVRGDRLKRWYRPGLVAIGDAAHVVSPAVGAGINLAVQDAVVAANVLSEPLLDFQRYGSAVSEGQLASVQRRRELPVRFVAALQGAGHRAVDNAHEGRPPMPKAALRLMGAPLVRNILAHVVGIGLWRVRVREPGPRAGVERPRADRARRTGLLWWPCGPRSG